MSTTVAVSVTDSVGGTNTATPGTTNTSSASSGSHSGLSPDVIGIIVAVAVALLVVVIWVLYKRGSLTRSKPGEAYFCTSSPLPQVLIHEHVLTAFPHTPSQHPDLELKLELDRLSSSARPRGPRPIPRPANVAHSPGDQHPLPEPELLARRLASLERTPVRALRLLALAPAPARTCACTRVPPCVAGRRRDGRGGPHDTDATDADELRPEEPRHARVPRPLRAFGTPRALGRVESEHAGDVRAGESVAARRGRRGASAARPGPAAPGDPRRSAGTGGREYRGRDGQLGLEGQRSLGSAAVRLGAWGLRFEDDAVCVEVVLGWLWGLGSSVFGLCYYWTGSSRVGEWRTT